MWECQERRETCPDTLHCALEMIYSYSWVVMTSMPCTYLKWISHKHSCSTEQDKLSHQHCLGWLHKHATFIIAHSLMLSPTSSLQFTVNTDWENTSCMSTFSVFSLGHQICHNSDTITNCTYFTLTEIPTSQWAFCTQKKSLPTCPKMWDQHLFLWNDHNSSVVHSHFQNASETNCLHLYLQILAKQGQL